MTMLSSKYRTQLIDFMGKSIDWFLYNDSANIYLLKVNSKKIRKRCEICSELTIKTPERRQ